MRIAVCDDKKQQIEIIKAALERYLSEDKEAAEIDTFDKAFDFLDAQEKNAYDLVLLDICMPGMLGTDVAREIRKHRDQTEIIFLTTSDEFAVDAFAVKAAHYLIKPFRQEEFDEALHRAILNRREQSKKTVTFKCAGGIVETVDKNAIQYIESTSHIQNIFLSGGVSFAASQSLNEIKKALDTVAPGQFINPYKGYIVNQRFIRTIENDKMVLQGGKEIPIPRRSFRDIKQIYFDYMFKGKK